MTAMHRPATSEHHGDNVVQLDAWRRTDRPHLAAVDSAVRSRKRGTDDDPPPLAS